MGYRGKLVERERARQLRRAGRTMPEIAAALGVSRSSVSLWTRDIAAPVRGRRRPAVRRPNALERRKQAEIAAMLEEGRRRIGSLSERDLLVAGAALYAGEGAKSGGSVRFANCDPLLHAMFVAWLRTFFLIDESRLRVAVYLHEGLDLVAATAFWSDVVGVPERQFTRPYRAVPDASIRATKHPMGCAYVTYSCARTHRAVMGLVAALLSSAGRGPG